MNKIWKVIFIYRIISDEIFILVYTMRVHNKRLIGYITTIQMVNLMNEYLFMLIDVGWIMNEIFKWTIVSEYQGLSKVIYD